jgi:hypothetical protein
MSVVHHLYPVDMEKVMQLSITLAHWSSWDHSSILVRSSTVTFCLGQRIQPIIKTRSMQVTTLEVTHRLLYVFIPSWTNTKPHKLLTFCTVTFSIIIYNFGNMQILRNVHHKQKWVHNNCTKFIFKCLHVQHRHWQAKGNNTRTGMCIKVIYAECYVFGMVSYASL